MMYILKVAQRCNRAAFNDGSTKHLESKFQLQICYQRNMGTTGLDLTAKANLMEATRGIEEELRSVKSEENRQRPIKRRLLRGR